MAGAAKILAITVFTIVGSGVAFADVRLACDAEGAGDISLSAKYEERTRTGRQKFSAEFEAAPRSGFRPGQRMVVFVESVNVGSVVLRRIAGGDVQGDLNFDTVPDGDARPFPNNFPDVKSNSLIAIRIGGDKVLGCRLR